MALTVNQILVICLIIVLAVFLAILANLAIHTKKLMGNINNLTEKSGQLMDKTSGAVDRVETSITDTAMNLVDNADYPTKAIAGAVIAVVGIYVASRILSLLPIATIEEARSRKSAKRTKKNLAEVKKAARKAKKIQKNAAKLI